MPTWRAGLFLTSVAVAGTLYASWCYIPGFPEGAKLVMSDAKAFAKHQLEEPETPPAPERTPKPTK